MTMAPSQLLFIFDVWVYQFRSYADITFLARSSILRVLYLMLRALRACDPTNTKSAIAAAAASTTDTGTNAGAGAGLVAARIRCECTR